MYSKSKSGGEIPPKRKPAGGFILISVTQLLMVWCAFHKEHRIGLKDLRVWFALFEMKARRCGSKKEATYSIEEIRGLVGGAGGETLQESIRSLKRAGLIRSFTSDTIELASDIGDLTFDAASVHEALDQIPHHDRLVPVPRRILRLMAGGARRTLIATLLGHMVRCLFFKKGLVHPSGATKASWIADVFGVSDRRVHEMRQLLIELGILVALETPQRVLNRYGQWCAFNLEWSAEDDQVEPKSQPIETKAAELGAGAPLELSPPPAQIPPASVTPIENEKPLRDLKTRKPDSVGPTGSFKKEDEGKKPGEPNLRDVTVIDLREPARLLSLHEQAVVQKIIGTSESERLNFFAAANHARVIGSKNPPGLFVRIIRSKLFGFLTQDDEDAARVQIKRALYPEGQTPKAFHSEPLRSFSGPTFSDDARFVRDVTRVLQQRGIPESSVWRFVNRERPDWTRERWDAAEAELKGGRAGTAIQNAQNEKLRFATSYTEGACKI